MKKAFAVFLLIGAFSQSAYSDDPPAGDTPPVSSVSEVPTINQPAMIPPPITHVFEGDVNGAKYHDEASFNAAANAAWEARKQAEIDKAVRGGYIVNLNGTDYGSAESFAKRDLRDRYTYIDENGIPGTYADANGNYLTKKQFADEIRANSEKVISMAQRSIEEGIAQNAGVTGADIKAHNDLVNSMRSIADEQIAKVNRGVKLISGDSEPRVVVNPDTTSHIISQQALQTEMSVKREGQITVLNDMRGTGTNLTKPADSGEIKNTVVSTRETEPHQSEPIKPERTYERPRVLVA